MSVLDKKLEELPELTTGINDTDIIYIKRAGVSYKLQAGALTPMRSATATGTNTYLATLTPAITALTPTLRLFVRFTNANTGPATLNLNGLGAKPIVKNVSTALTTGDILAGQILCLAYDGTNFQIVGSAGPGGGIADNDYTEFDNLSAFPLAGEADLLYLAKNTNLLYRWTGSAYVVVGGNAGAIASVLRLPEQTTAPTAATDEIVLYSSDEDGRTIPRFKDSAGFVISALPGVILIYNNTGSTLTPGQVVQVAAPSQSGRPQVTLAQQTSAVPAVGIVAESIANNAAGFIRVSGSITNLNTSAFADNDVLYKGANGALTNVRPTAPNYAQMVAFVLRSHNTQGRIFVFAGPILNDDRSTNQNSYAIGDGLAGNKRIVANNADASKPEIRYNDTTNAWEFTNNGTVFTAFANTTQISVLDNDQKTLKIYKSTNFNGF